MGAQDAESQALLAHIVSQVESNVQFLASQNYISQADASAFLAKLPNGSAAAGGNSTMNGLTSRFKNIVSPPGPPMPAARAVPAAPAAAPLKRAKALWAYNENGQDGEDLSFSAGDIIEIIEETNADWWKGRVHGREALFPSAYVEKLKEPPTPAVGKSATPYRPFGAALHGADTPPPAQARATNSVGLQETNQEEKKSKYGKLGNTMAHSAAGGVGFGAGAAIGGGLVRAIF